MVTLRLDNAPENGTWRIFAKQDGESIDTKTWEPVAAPLLLDIDGHWNFVRINVKDSSGFLVGEKFVLNKTWESGKSYTFDWSTGQLSEAPTLAPTVISPVTIGTGLGLILLIILFFLLMPAAKIEV